jgi:hypothetical protein
VTPKNDLCAFGRAAVEIGPGALVVSPNCAEGHALLLVQEDILNAR